MNKQDQWLFEVPPTYEVDKNNLESLELSDREWEVGIKPRTGRRVSPQPSQKIRRPGRRASPQPLQNIRRTQPLAQKSPRSVQQARRSPRALRTLTYADVRSDRIDVFAQKALLRMSKNSSMSADAAEMAAAVKSGKLGGIYKEDEKVPALRIKKINPKFWWIHIIPKEEDAVLFLDPDNPMQGIPIIVFRDRVRSDPTKLDPALQKAWASFRLINSGKVKQCPINGLGGLVAESHSVTPVRNIVPARFCQVPGTGSPPVATTIELINSSGSVINPALNGVHFGLFDNAVELDPNPLTQNDPLQDPLLNEASEARNFVGADSRRFHIRLRNPDPQNVQTLPNGTRTVNVQWFTTFSNGQILDNNKGKSTITLIETGSPGIFESRGLMLVTNQQDQNYPTHCGISSLYPTHQLNRRVGQSDHRTRLGGLFSNVNVLYKRSSNPNPIKVIVPAFTPTERKSLPLQIFVVVNGSTMHSSISIPGLFDASLRKAREIYERLGIFLYTVEHPVAESNPNVQKISGGLGGKDFVYKVPSSATLSAFSAVNEGQISLAFPRTGDTIRVFVVEGLANGNPGESYVDADSSGDARRGASFITSDVAPGKALLAHEIGHLLTDKSTCFGKIADPNTTPPFPNRGGGHFTRPSGNNRFIHFYNLIGGTRFRLWDVSVPETIVPTTGCSVTTQTFNQFQDIRNSKFVRS